MEPSTTGSFRLFRLAGIDVFLHWSWFAIAVVQILTRSELYDAAAWKVAEYLTLFAIVLLHEFGHALACRSVGGQADRIVLWPLGGIAYVSPPARPGAVLWSIAAGPLVNLVLAFPLLTAAVWMYVQAGGGPFPRAPDEVKFVVVVAGMNLGLLLLNLLPIYPLDGGQIVQALLWFALGRWRSLQVASILGGFGGAVLFLAALALAPSMGTGAFFLAFIAAFIALRSLIAYQTAGQMLRLEGLPRHRHCACPGCGEAPPRGAFWLCEHCGAKFDTFASRGECPSCGGWYFETACPHCHGEFHVNEWFKPEEVLDPILVEQKPAGDPPAPGTPPPA